METKIIIDFLSSIYEKDFDISFILNYILEITKYNHILLYDNKFNIINSANINFKFNNIINTNSFLTTKQYSCDIKLSQVYCFLIKHYDTPKGFLILCKIEDNS